MKVFNLVISGKPYKVEIEDPSAKPLRVTVNGRPYVVETQDVLTNSAQVGQSSSAGAIATASEAPSIPIAPVVATPSGGKVTSPLPGKVLSVRVKVGDPVKRGDEVCTLESMKMEQSIRAECSGVVKAVPVSAGQTVAHGQVLVEVA